MSVYFCDKCNKQFNRLYNLQRHLEKQSSCNNDELGVSNSTLQLTYENLREPTRTYENLREPISNTNSSFSNRIAPIIEDEDNYYNCPYCKLRLRYSKNYKKHLRLSCEEIPEILKNKILKKYNKNKKHLNTLENNIINDNSIINNNTTNNNTTNNNTNNNNSINTNNNTQNNTINQSITNNIKINPMGKEDISKIPYEKKKEIVLSKINMFKNVLNAVLDIPENRNTYILNKREGLAVFLNDKNQLEIDRVKKIIDDYVLNYYNIIYDMYNEVEPDLTTTQKQQHNVEYNKMTPIFKNKLIKEQVYCKLLSFGKICKKALDTFIEQIDNETLNLLS